MIQDAMDHQVGITANRRSEMRVRFSRQRKVSAVLVAVASLLERTQHQIVENALLWLTGHLRNQALIVAGRNFKIVAGQHYVLSNFAAIARSLDRGESLYRQGSNAE